MDESPLRAEGTGMQRTYRSGVATILMWVGPLVAVVPSIVFVILPLALLATGQVRARSSCSSSSPSP